MGRLAAGNGMYRAPGLAIQGPLYQIRSGWLVERITQSPLPGQTWKTRAHVSGAHSIKLILSTLVKHLENPFILHDLKGTRSP